MGGIGDALFGSSGEPGRVEDITPEEFRGLRDPVADSLRTFIEQGGGPEFEGDFTAPITDREQSFLDLAREQAQPSERAQNAFRVAQDQLSATAQGEFLSPDSNPFLQATIEAAQRPVVQRFRDETLPRLRSQFTGAGQQVQPESSSPFDRAAALASRGLTQELGDISSQLAGQNFQRERSRQQAAANALPQQALQFEQGQLDQVLRGLESQALPRLIEQRGIDRGLEEFRRRTDALLQALNVAGGLAQAQPASVQGTQGQPGLLQGVARGLTTALAD